MNFYAIWKDDVQVAQAAWSRKGTVNFSEASYGKCYMLYYAVPEQNGPSLYENKAKHILF